MVPFSAVESFAARCQKSAQDVQDAIKRSGDGMCCRARFSTIDIVYAFHPVYRLDRLYATSATSKQQGGSWQIIADQKLITFRKIARSGSTFAAARISSIPILVANAN